jgi:hypothetical protein
MTKRGDIYNPARASQLVSFSDFRYGKITPTDVDGLIDFGGNSFVFMELKFNDTLLPYGQRLAIENMSMRLIRGGATVIAIVGEHQTPINEAIVAANATVREYLYHGAWQSPQTHHTCKSLVDAFIARAQSHNGNTDIRQLMLFE